MNFSKKLLMLIYFLGLGVFVFASKVQMPSALSVEKSSLLSDDEVIVYGTNQFYGKSAKIKLGSVSAAELKEKGIYVIRSIKVPRGIKAVIVYDDKANETIYSTKEKINTRGYSKVIVAKYGTVVSSKLSKEKSSSTINGSMAKVTYSITGAQSRFSEGRYDWDQIKARGLRFAQHVDIPKGYKLTAYSLSGFKGKSKTLYRSGKIGFLASSFELKKLGTSQTQKTKDPTNTLPDKSPKSTSKKPYIVVFGDYNGKGKLTTFRPGRYTWDQIKARGILFVKSIKVSEGFEVISYSMNNFKGEQEVFTSNGNTNKRGMSIEVRKIKD